MKRLAQGKNPKEKRDRDGRAWLWSLAANTHKGLVFQGPYHKQLLAKHAGDLRFKSIPPHLLVCFYDVRKRQKEPGQAHAPGQIALLGEGWGSQLTVQQRPKGTGSFGKHQ